MIKKLISLAVLATITGVGVMNFTVSIDEVQAGVAGTYSGLKLPWTAGQSKMVTGAAASHAKNDAKNKRTPTVRHAIDFGLKDENVLAMKSGVVTHSFFDRSGGGNTVRIDHGDGYCSNYLHLSSAKVSVGQSVPQGQLIAISGNTGGSNMPYHLHASVTKKVGNVCTGDRTQEIEMRFVEKPERELLYGDWVTSKNTTSSGSTLSFVNGGSFPTISISTINNTISASNLAGKIVYLQMWRNSAYGYPPKEWNFSKTASSNSVTFSDIDGAGNTFAAVDYYLVASLNPIPSGTAARQRTACRDATGGRELCDKVRR
jgi:hypothetical protein